MIGVAIAMCGCELESSVKTEITAQSGSTVIMNSGEGTATVSQQEEVAAEK